MGTVIPIDYDVFQASKQDFADHGGPWLPGNIHPIPPKKPPLFVSYTHPRCTPTGLCLYSSINGAAQAFSQQITYSTNISVDMTQYGDATALDFSWTFWPLYMGGETTIGTPIGINSRVNDVSFDDTMNARNISEWFLGPLHGSTHSEFSDTPQFFHTGTVPITRGGKNNKYGSILISINYFLDVHSEKELLVTFTREIGFKITTPIQSITSSATSTSTSALSNGTSATLNTLGSGTRIPSTPSLQLDFSTTASLGPEVSYISSDETSQAPQHKLPTAVIVGVVLGSLALLFCILGLICLRLRRSKRHDLASPVNLDASLTPFPREKYGRPTSRVPQEPSSMPTSSPSVHETPFIHPQRQRGAPSILTENQPPPIYATRGSQIPYDMPPVTEVLALWAQMNRELISEDLEARLEAAGYVPTDDPNSLSEEEWRSQHNVTKLEFVRLRALYHRQTRLRPVESRGSASSHDNALPYLGNA